MIFADTAEGNVAAAAAAEESNCDQLRFAGMALFLGILIGMLGYYYATQDSPRTILERIAAGYPRARKLMEFVQLLIAEDDVPMALEPGPEEDIVESLGDRRVDDYHFPPPSRA